MDKIVIDTNILYSWTQLSVNPKFPPDKIKELSKSNELYCGTPSIIEFLVKYRHDMVSMRRCLEPIINKELLIVSIGFVPIPSATLIELYDPKYAEKHSFHLSEILELKINKEAEMLRFFLFCILGGLFNVLKDERGYAFQDREKEMGFRRASNVLLKANSEVIYDRFVEALRMGYSNNSEEQTIRHIFSEWTMTLLHQWIYTYYLAKYNALLKPDLSTSENCKKEVAGDTIWRTFEKHRDNPFAILKGNKFKIFTEQYINNLQSVLDNHPLIPDKVLDHILLKLTNTFAKGAKIRKNDIMDLFLLYAFELKGFKIITLDSKLRKSIEIIHPASHQIMRTLGLA